jgi:hypothetical protein
MKPPLSLVRTGKRVAICLLAALLVSVMISWLALLGWGTVEVWQGVKSFWTVHS